MIKMDKLGAYECYVCKSSLVARSSDPMEGGTMLTHFSCVGCGLAHYYVENPYIAPPEQTLPKECKFCNKQCIYYGLADDWQDYWKCDNCNVHYNQWLKGRDEMGHGIQMYVRINNRTYCLRQFLTENKSRLDFIPDNPEDTMVIVRDFDFLFPDVTPQNIKDKLSIYILFS